MLRKVFSGLLLCMILFSCKDGEKTKPSADPVTPGSELHSFFPKTSLPYQLTDTALLNTPALEKEVHDFSKLLADSIRNTFFGKNTVIKFTPLGYLTNNEKENFYIIQASAGRKKAAFLLVYDASGVFAASTAFLIPDDNPNTTQATTIDKSFTITKTIVQRNASDNIAEGKEVIAYEPSTKSFSLIMLDALEDNPGILRNPIDTFPKTNKLAGDYQLNKKNIVSVRDGRHANQLLVFIHMENEAGDCIGQLKGEFIMTSSSTAAYRQAGDPCVLNLSFKGATVSINEASGCGNYRGLDCVFAGTYTRKKSQPLKSSPGTTNRK